MEAKHKIWLHTCVELAIHHRNTCHKEECPVSLYALLELLDAAGVEVPIEFIQVFM